MTVAFASTAVAVEILCAQKVEGLFELQVSANECDGVLAEANSPFELITYLLAEWLTNGAPITVELGVETSGELLLEDKNGYRYLMQW
jgi:hypothetical protein